MVRVVAPERIPTKGFEPSPAERSRALIAQTRGAVEPDQNMLAATLARTLSPSGGTASEPGILAGAIRDLVPSSPPPPPPPVDGGMASAAAPQSPMAVGPAVRQMMADGRQVPSQHLDVTSDDGTAGHLSQLLANAKPRTSGFFTKDGAWRDVLGYTFDLLSGAPNYANGVLRRHRREQQLADQARLWARETAKRNEDRAWQVEDRDAKENAPQYFSSGRDRVRLDPATGTSQVVYDGPEDYQTYASTLDLQPGDDGYDDAVQDYVLRGNGPTSQAARLRLEDTRQAGRQALRSSPTYANLHPAARQPRATTAGSVVGPIVAKMAAGTPLTPGEQAALDYYKKPRAAGGRTRPAATAGPARITSRAQYDALPKGSSYTAPDGTLRTKN